MYEFENWETDISNIDEEFIENAFYKGIENTKFKDLEIRDISLAKLPDSFDGTEDPIPLDVILTNSRPIACFFVTNKNRCGIKIGLSKDEHL